jgi:hypothetical protein
MWWSQADAATYRAWLTEAGLEVTSRQFVLEGDGGHALFWAQARQPTRHSMQAGTGALRQLRGEGVCPVPGRRGGRTWARATARTQAMPRSST